jgi:hypothetical protein
MIKDMIIDKAYYVGTHRYSLNAGIPAEIIGVVLATPTGLDQRLCYHVRWSDGKEDWTPVHDTKAYEIISFNDILKGNIPKIK